MTRRFFLFTLCLLQGALSGCDDVSGSLDLQLDEPSGLALVDQTGWIVVGQDSGDAATFIELDPEAGVAQQLMSPAFYLPLKWSLMPDSRSWTSVPSGGALYVSGLTGQIEYIDFRQVEAGATNGAAFTRSGTLFEDAVGTLTLSAEECGDTCVVRAWASLPLAGAVAEFSLSRDDSGAYIWTEEARFDSGGVPWEIVTSRDGSMIFGSDIGTPEVFQIRTSNGELERVSTSTSPGPISISTDDRTLLVARPQSRDVLLLETDLLGPASSKNFLAPDISCVPGCADDSGSCVGLHPYNEQLCYEASPEGTVFQSATDYTGLYVGIYTETIAAVGAGAGDPAWVSTCGDETRRYDEVFLMAGIEDGLRFVGRDASTLQYELISDSFCESIRPGAKTNGDVFAAALASSATTIDDTSSIGRLVTVLAIESLSESGDDETDEDVAETSETFEMLAMNYAVGDLRLTLSWEGLASLQLSRPLGSGILTLNADGQADLVDDLGLNLSRFDDSVKLGSDLRVQGECLEGAPCGDLIVFTEGLTIDDACLAALQVTTDAEAACALERRIETVVEEEGNTFWKLNSPLPDACIPSSGRVGYEVRAAREYKLTSGNRSYRVRPGESFGFGTSNGAREPIHLQFKDLDDQDTCSGPAGVERGKDGYLQLLDSNRIATGTTWPSGIWRLSQSLEGTSYELNFRLPTDMKVWRGEEGPSVLVTLAGTNRLLYFKPMFEEGEEANPLNVFRSLEWYQNRSRFWLIQ